jgi:hypothetical protein
MRKVLLYSSSDSWTVHIIYSTQGLLILLEKNWFQGFLEGPFKNNLFRGFLEGPFKNNLFQGFLEGPFKNNLFQGFLEGLNTCSTFFSETNVELDKMARRAEAAEDALDGAEVRIRIFARRQKIYCSAYEAKQDKKKCAKILKK